MSESEPFASMSAEQARQELVQITRWVCRGAGRVEITDGDCTCILLSKQELESLERALEILSNTSEVRHVARQIAALTATAAGAPLPIGADDGEN